MIAGFAQRAHARASDHITLDYRADDGCSSADDILGAIDRQTGPDFESDTQLRAQVQLTSQSPTDFELVVDYSSSSAAADHRVIHAESCAAAKDAVALLLALALVPKPPANEREASASTSTPSRNEVGVLGAVDTALMHDPALGGGLQIAVRLGAFRISLQGLQWLRQQFTRGAVQLDIEYVSVALGACYLAQLGVLETGPCAHIEIGRLGGFASGADGARPDGARVQAAALGGYARLRVLAPLWLMIEPSVEWLERRPRFVVDEIGQLHQPAAWGVRLVFGPVFIW